MYYENIKKCLTSHEPQIINAALNLIYDESLKDRLSFIS